MKAHEEAFGKLKIDVGASKAEKDQVNARNKIIRNPKGFRM